MKKAALLFLSLMICNVIFAKEKVIWKNSNVVVEKKVNDQNGELTFSIQAKEVQYQYMYYMLTLSEGSADDLLADVLEYSSSCKKEKGDTLKLKETEVISSDGAHVYVKVLGDLGFARLNDKEIRKINKVLRKYKGAVRTPAIINHVASKKEYTLQSI